MARPIPPLQTALFVILFGLLLPGCGGPPMQQSTPYLPPTPAGLPAASPTPLLAGSTPAADRPTPTIECKDSLTYIGDVTIPDGTVVVPESTLDKRWEVQNTGNCNWGEAYRIRQIAGPELGAQKEQALFPARSGGRAMIRIQFKAPKEAGTYRSAWQAFTPQGEPFGDPFFIEVVVETP